MPLSQEFIWNRAAWTVSTQRQIADTWVWSGKTLAEWDVDLAIYQERRKALTMADINLKRLRGGLEARMESLHEVTVVYLILLKSLYRKDAARHELLAPLTAAGGSRNDTLDEATELQTVWQTIDAAWEPMPGRTLAEFVNEIKICAETKTTFAEANTAWRNRASEARVFAEELNEACVVWYAAATAVFSEETIEGDIIRRFVPTTYSPSTQSEPTEVAA